MTTNGLIQEIKSNDEDFEWYPTTFEIVDKIAEEMAMSNSHIMSILDIGCGNGGFFEKLDRTNHFYNDDWKHHNHNSKLSKHYIKCGIEKSNILAEQLPDDVILLGSDFHSNTLIDKKVDVIFCNPPYSEYEEWAEKIIMQGNATYIFLVIPQRWKNSERIKAALKKRHFEIESLGTFDFSNAERKARATVDVLSIRMEGTYMNGRRYDSKTTDPFDTWFDETFKFQAEKTVQHEYEQKEDRRNEIIQKGDTVEMLVKFYNDDMEKLYNNYRALEKLDSDLFKELKVDIKMLKESLKNKLQGLKNLYWDLLFKKYSLITSRLTTAGKNRVTKKLNDNTSIDFTVENIFQLTMWIIRHSNTLIDTQLSDYFFSLCDPENIHRYKSNKRWNDDDWRYLKESIKERGYHFSKDKAKEKLKNVMLDYRVIVTGWRNFTDEWGGNHKICESTLDFLYDTKVIADNLGFRLNFDIPDAYDRVDISDWSNRNIYTTSGELFCNLKLYKNGNRHIRFNKKFMGKLNVEMARINGWIQNKGEAMNEMDISEKDLSDFWKSNLKIEAGESRKLLGLEVNS